MRNFPKHLVRPPCYCLTFPLDASRRLYCITHSYCLVRSQHALIPKNQAATLPRPTTVFKFGRPSRGVPKPEDSGYTSGLLLPHIVITACCCCFCCPNNDPNRQLFLGLRRRLPSRILWPLIMIAIKTLISPKNEGLNPISPKTVRLPYKDDMV